MRKEKEKASFSPDFKFKSRLFSPLWIFIFFTLLFFESKARHAEEMAANGDKKAAAKCELLELFQYHCAITEDFKGHLFRCTPIQRLYRKCGKGPLVDVTHVAEYNEETGKYSLPAHLQDSMPPSVQWRDLA